MAPLDLDKYVEIARLCKYLPENDLKVSRAGAGALLARLAPSVSGLPAGPPFSPRDPRQHPVLSQWRAWRGAKRPSRTWRLAESGEGGAGVPRMLSQFRSRHPGGCRGLCSGVAPLGFRVPGDSDP